MSLWSVPCCTLLMPCGGIGPYTNYLVPGVPFFNRGKWATVTWLSPPYLGTFKDIYLGIIIHMMSRFSTFYQFEAWRDEMKRSLFVWVYVLWTMKPNRVIWKVSGKDPFISCIQHLIKYTALDCFFFQPIAFGYQEWKEEKEEARGGQDSIMWRKCERLWGKRTLCNISFSSRGCLGDIQMPQRKKESDKEREWDREGEIRAEKDGEWNGRKRVESGSKKAQERLQEEEICSIHSEAFIWALRIF